MKLIKLDAIDSTNDFLKGLISNQVVENFTVVTAENQTKGRGQMGAKWLSEISKNLIMSALIKDSLADINEIYNLNVAVSVAIISALEEYNIPKLNIKWPNDILADNKKIGGILIENTIKTNGEVLSVVGIGLNVNQDNFEGLSKASSLRVIMNENFDRDELLIKIIDAIKQNVILLINNQSEILWEKYHNLLFRKGIPMPFEMLNGQKIMGIIQGVNDNGKLLLMLEDDSIQSFEIKEIQMLY